MTKKFHFLAVCIAMSGTTAFAQFDKPDIIFGYGENVPTSIVELDEPPQTKLVANEDSELVRERFPNGKVRTERWVAESPEGDFVNHGSYVQYNERAEPIISGEFRMGKRDGAWTKQINLVAAQGLTNTIDRGFAAPFTSKASFADGSLEGDWTCTDSRGTLLFVWAFEDGQRNGMSTYFNSRGEVIRSISYVDNMADGPAKISIRSDRPVKDVMFQAGMMKDVAEEYYPQVRGKKRVLKSQEQVLTPSPVNLESHDWDSNTIRYQKYESSDRVRHGRAVTFYPNGQRESEGQYEKGLRQGTFVWWYSNGQQKTVGDYKDDETEGRWTWWHENGMREARGEFLNGIRKTSLLVWDKGGRLIKRTPIDHDPAFEQVATQPPRIENQHMIELK